jgi:hypothetical protein
LGYLVLGGKVLAPTAKSALAPSISSRKAYMRLALAAFGGKG